MANPFRPRVVFQPQAYRGFGRGIEQIVRAVRPTLGPVARTVAIAPIVSARKPEILDDGGVIARRIVQLPGRDEDMGAMLVRSLLWRLHEDVGDGTATAAVLLEAVYRQGTRYIVAGGNAMRLRDRLERAIDPMLAILDQSVTHLDGRSELARMAESLCHDPPLSDRLGEIIDIIGEHGQLEVRPGHGRTLEREYVEGACWKSGLLSRQLVTDRLSLRAEAEGVAVLLSDVAIDDPADLVPVMEIVLQARIPALLLVVRQLSDHALAFLVANQAAPKLKLVAVRVPGNGAEEQAANLEDLAILTGGRPRLTVSGDRLGGITLADLGRARGVWADVHQFGLVGGLGDPHALRQHIANLRGRYKTLAGAADRQKLDSRLGKLLGGSATLWVGGATALEIDTRQKVAERTAQVLRACLAGGVVPGGGVALLACRSALPTPASVEDDPDGRAAARILHQALAAPLQAIAANAGYDPAQVVAQVEALGDGYGFDAVAGKFVRMAEAGIFDSAAVVKAALRGAVTTAALALTVDVLVQRRTPELAPIPR